MESSRNEDNHRHSDVHLIPLDTRSVMAWQGLHPCKWRGGRMHLRAVGEFEKPDHNYLPALGRKHFPPQQTKIKNQVPCMKMFPNWTSKGMEFDKGNKLTYVPPTRKYLPEKLLISMKSGEIQRQSMKTNNNFKFQEIINA